MALHATPTSQSIRLAPLGIHYGMIHEALLKGATSLAHRLALPLLQLGDASARKLPRRRTANSSLDVDLARQPQRFGWTYS